MKKVLLIDCGNYNAVTTVQINYIKCLLKVGYSISYIIFKDKNKIDTIKYKRWPQHENLNYIEIDSCGITLNLIRKVVGNVITNYFLMRRILNEFNQAICFEHYSSSPAYIHSIFNKYFKYQIASLELYNTKSWLVKKSFQNARLITTQDELRKEQIENYYNLSTPSNVGILYNTSLSFEEITTEKVEVPARIANQKKILFIGSLITEHCIEEVMDWIYIIPDNFCVVFHGWGLTKLNKNKIENLEKLFPHKVWLSNLVLDEREKWKMYNIADFGIVMFNKNHRNNEFAGLSAGKLFDFIRVGVPVIVSETKLLTEFVLDNEFGFQFSKEIFVQKKNNPKMVLNTYDNKDFYFDYQFNFSVLKLI